MQAYFHTENNYQLLFKPVLIDSKTDAILACLVTCAVTVLYEGLRCLRVNIAQHYKASGGEMHITSKTHLLQTVLYLTELMMAYFLMLAAMTYNLWLFLAVALGALIGFQLCTIFSRSHLAVATSANVAITDGKEKHKEAKSSSGQTGLTDQLQPKEERICISREKYKMKDSCQASVSNPDEITELMTSI